MYLKQQFLWLSICRLHHPENLDSGKTLCTCISRDLLCWKWGGKCSVLWSALRWSPSIIYKISNTNTSKLMSLHIAPFQVNHRNCIEQRMLPDVTMSSSARPCITFVCWLQGRVYWHQREGVGMDLLTWGRLATAWVWIDGVSHPCDQSYHLK